MVCNVGNLARKTCSGKSLLSYAAETGDLTKLKEYEESYEVDEYTRLDKVRVTYPFSCEHMRPLLELPA